MYTTQGYMTRADLDDYQDLTDTGPNPECPGHDTVDMNNCDVTVRCSVNEECPEAM